MDQGREGQRLRQGSDSPRHDCTDAAPLTPPEVAADGAYEGRATPDGERDGDRAGERHAAEDESAAPEARGPGAGDCERQPQDLSGAASEASVGERREEGPEEGRGGPAEGVGAEAGVSERREEGPDARAGGAAARPEDGREAAHGPVGAAVEAAEERHRAFVLRAQCTLFALLRDGYFAEGLAMVHAVCGATRRAVATAERRERQALVIANVVAEEGAARAERHAAADVRGAAVGLYLEALKAAGAVWTAESIARAERMRHEAVERAEASGRGSIRRAETLAFASDVVCAAEMDERRAIDEAYGLVREELRMRAAQLDLAEAEAHARADVRQWEAAAHWAVCAVGERVAFCGREAAARGALGEREEWVCLLREAHADRETCGRQGVEAAERWDTARLSALWPDTQLQVALARVWRECGAAQRGNAQAEAAARAGLWRGHMAAMEWLWRHRVEAEATAEAARLPVADLCSRERVARAALWRALRAAGVAVEWAGCAAAALAAEAQERAHLRTRARGDQERLAFHYQALTARAELEERACAVSRKWCVVAVHVLRLWLAEDAGRVAMAEAADRAFADLCDAETFARQRLFGDQWILRLQMLEGERDAWCVRMAAWHAASVGLCRVGGEHTALCRGIAVEEAAQRAALRVRAVQSREAAHRRALRRAEELAVGALRVAAAEERARAALALAAWRAFGACQRAAVGLQHALAAQWLRGWHDAVLRRAGHTLEALQVRTVEEHDRGQIVWQVCAPPKPPVSLQRTSFARFFRHASRPRRLSHECV